MKGLKSRSPADVKFFFSGLVRNAMGLPNPIDTPDRRALEQVILPASAGCDDMRTVLFVG